MAVPVLDSGFTFTKTNGTAESITLTLASNIAVDDLLLLIVMDDADGETSSLFNTPAGYTSLASVGSTDDTWTHIFWKIAETADITTAVTVLHSATADELIGWQLRVTGADDTDPVDVVGTGTTGAGTTVTIPSITTGVANTLAFYANSADGGDCYPFSVAGGNWTEQGEGQEQTDGNTTAGSFGTQDMDTASDTTDAVVTQQQNEGYAGIQFSIQEQQAGTVIGTLTKTLADLTLSGTGESTHEVEASNTLDDLTIDSTASAPITALMGPVLDTGELDPLTVSSASTLSSEVNASNTLDDLTVSSDGSVADSPALGDAEITLDDLTVSSESATPLSGEASNTLDAITIDSTAATTLSGESAFTLEDLTVDSEGAITGGGVAGILDVTLDDITVSSTVSTSLAADLSISLDAMTLVSAGISTIVGVSSTTLEGVGVSSGASTGTALDLMSYADLHPYSAVAFGGEFNTPIAGDASGELTATLDGMTLSSRAFTILDIIPFADIYPYGTVPFGGSHEAVEAVIPVVAEVSITLDDMVLVAEAGVLILGSLNITLDDATLTSDTTILDPVEGNASIQLGDLTLSSHVFIYDPVEGNSSLLLEGIYLSSSLKLTNEGVWVPAPPGGGNWVEDSSTNHSWVEDDSVGSVWTSE